MVEWGFNGDGPNLTSLKVKACTMCGDPKMLVDATKSYLGAEDVKTRNCALEVFKLFGSTKRKLNIPPGVDYESH